MSTVILARTGWIAVFAVAYLMLYQLSGLIIANHLVAGSVSVLFLPAFIRLLGYLTIGLWVIIALLIANTVLVLTGAFDLVPGQGPELFVAFAAAFGAPLATHLTVRLMRLEPSLENVSPVQLLVLSVACSLGNTLVYGSSLWLRAPQLIDTTIFTPIFVGDMIGTWLMIYAVKFLLEAYLRSRRP